MPSWNIHTAHVELLLESVGAARLGVRDENEFLFGNFVPDIYVGYMVKGATHRIDYKLTHLAERDHVPLPDYERFWRFYVVDPERYGASRTSDLVLGAWCHLVCDHVYNAHTRRFLEAHGLHASEQARIGKQADFALWGRTLWIKRKVELTDALLASCAAFPQYSIDERDVRAAVEVARRIVDDNQARHVRGNPSYQMLDEEFFSAASIEANQIMVEGLTGRV